ncbi:hypothetical protein ACFOLL_08355 [Falsochrobactrum ovis]|uniref:Murein L,D-transpeptidase YafK n=1 Tax=Falsochrobactrum ovis TaxID=1293442 RepID=A0A364JYK2_9HYPH|nr:murein L,D-transpeptidase family protein [Falsochrobactrum ovis]RAK33796.1 murein L,D-transpeptidase YafK [Falsochrobactrum ovis]
MKIRSAIIATILATTFLAGCQGSTVADLGMRHETPLPNKIVAKMKAKGMSRHSPILVRIFKEENVLEVWKQKNNGKYDQIASYEICKWSGKLGPKFIEGDRQAPEGFYTVRPAQMNPTSQYYLAFNMGFPNAYDRVNERTGQHLMVHGACSSSGCYSMTDESVSEIYAFGRDAFRGGQRDFQIQAFPFRMTNANMARYRNDPNFEFWKMLKQGYDAFEATKTPPKVDVCEKRYVFNAVPEGETLDPAGACPPSVGNQSMAYASSYEKTFQSAFSASLKAPSPSIQGIAEAKLVSQWSAARARGERVSREPPSLTPASAEKPNAPDVAPIAQPVNAVATPQAVDSATVQPVSVPIPQNNPEAVQSPVTTATTIAEQVIPEKKKPWWKFGGN